MRRSRLPRRCYPREPRGLLAASSGGGVAMGRGIKGRRWLKFRPPVSLTRERRSKMVIDLVGKCYINKCANFL